MPNTGRNPDGSFFLETTGRLITASDLSNLTPAEIDELRASPLSKFDALFIHQSNHKLSNSIQSFMGSEENKKVDILDKLNTLTETMTDEFESLKKQFYVDAPNGTLKKKHIGDLILEHHKDLKGLRKRNQLKELLKGSLAVKIISWIGLVAIGALAVVFRNFFIDFFTNIF